MEWCVTAALAVCAALLAAGFLAGCAWLLRRRGSLDARRAALRRALGFQAASLPQGELIKLVDARRFGERAAELEYRVLPGWRLLLRVGRRGADLGREQLRGIFREKGVLFQNGARVLTGQNEGGAAALFWSRGGFDFLLLLPDTEMGLRGGLTPLFVAQTAMEER